MNIFIDELSRANTNYASTNFDATTFVYSDIDLYDADGTTDSQDEKTQETTLLNELSKSLFNNKTIAELTPDEKNSLESFLSEATGADGKFDATEWTNFQDALAEKSTETEYGGFQNKEEYKHYLYSNYPNLSDEERAIADKYTEEDEKKQKEVFDKIAQAIFKRNFDGLSQPEKTIVIIGADKADVDGDGTVSDDELNGILDRLESLSKKHNGDGVLTEKEFKKLSNAIQQEI